MPLEPLNLLTLNVSMHSPEAPHKIRAEIPQFLGRPISEDQVLEAFHELQAQGLVEEHGQGPHEPPNDVWFIATRAGRAAVERDWHGLPHRRRSVVRPNSALLSDAYAA